MTRIKRIFGPALIVALAAGPVAAQGIFDRGRDVLKGFGIEVPEGGSASSLSVGEISQGLKEALRVGSDRVVSTLGTTGGFNKSPDVHIPLPDKLRTVQSALGRIGMSGMADDLELRLNRAAETAVPVAKKLFWNAIEQMSIDDARGILNGPKDSATQYFRSKMSTPLAADMRPIVDRQLAEVGAVQAYDRMMGQYKTLPFLPDVKADLTDYVLDKAIGGVFLYLGREEAAIRENPAKRTTEILRKVFGN